ncbi:hypothetical protein J6590_046383 [Homalodisca vitripennis]|nr:hypothetical protein J6590_046383 [Homalodisca vitripennis]
MIFYKYRRPVTRHTEREGNFYSHISVVVLQCTWNTKPLTGHMGVVGPALQPPPNSLECSKHSQDKNKA